MSNNNETPCGLPQPTPVRLIEPVNLSTNRQQVRIQAAIAAMHAELSNPKNTFMMCEDKRGIIVRRAVRYADALVAELKKGGEDEND